MEEQLAVYRAKKAKEKEASKGSLSSALYSFTSGILSSRKRVTEVDSPHSVPEQSATTAHTGRPVTISTEGDILTEEKPFFSIETILKIILWFLLWGVFVELGFGAVYFIVSTSIILYRNTRTGPRQDGHLSAYSVFNPNYERLDGTFTAEQFEKELRHGAGSVH